MQRLSGRHQLFLRDTLRTTVGSHDAFQRLQTDLRTQVHQSVVDVFHIGAVRNVEGLLHDDAPRIDVLVEEEGRHTRLCLTVDDRPVDRGRTAILGQEGRMYVEGAVFRHIPHHLWKHSESDNHLQISLIAAQFLYKVRILHLLRLQDG